MPRPASNIHIVGLVRLRRHGRIWHVRYAGADGKRVERSLKLTNLRLAERKAREMSDLLERGDYPTLETRQQKITFGTFLQEFRERYTNWSEETWKGNQARVEKLKDEFGPLPLTAINARRVEGYLARRLDDPKRPITVASANRYLSTLRTIMKSAVRWGYLPFYPLEGVKTLKEEAQVPDGLHDEELEALLSHLPPYAYSICAVAGDTGMRYSELERLQWRDLDMQRHTITIRKTKSKEPRVIPMTERVHRIVRELRIEMDQERVKRTAVFEMSQCRKPLIHAAEKIGRKHFHFHQLRHTFATRLLDKGVPIEQVQYLMGHKTIAMTLRYDHARPDRYLEAIAALEQA